MEARAVELRLPFRSQPPQPRTPQQQGTDQPQVARGAHGLGQVAEAVGGKRRDMELATVAHVEDRFPDEADGLAHPHEEASAIGVGHRDRVARPQDRLPRR